MGLKDSINEGEKALNEMIEALGQLGVISNDAFTSISGNVGALVKELQEANQETSDLESSFTNQKSTVNDLAKSAEKLSKVTKEDLTDRKKVAAVIRERKKLESNVAKISRQIRLNEIELNRAKAEGNELAISAIELQQEQLRNAKETAQAVGSAFEEIDDGAEKINAAAKGFDNMGDTLGNIPGVGGALKKSFNAAGAAARDAAAKGQGFVGSMMAGAAEMVSIKAIVALLIKSLFAADKRTTQLAKSLQTTKKEALAVKNEYLDISMNSGKAYLNNKNLIESTVSLQKHLGASNRLSSELVTNATFLTKQMGLSEDSAGKLTELTKFQGKEGKKVNKEIATQVGNLKKQTGIVLNLNEVFEDVAKANGVLKAAYGFNTKELAKQVVKIKELGLNLDQAGKMARQLLDFEQSITLELEAELMTGKELNLEKARLLALQGKNTEAAAEMAKQVGGTNELMNMNVLAQEKLASAMGMTSNEMIESVQKREVLARLGAESIEQLKEQGKLDQLRGDAIGEQLLAAYEQESAAAKFEAAVIKLQEAFGTMMEGPFGSFINGLASAVSSAGTLYTIMGAMGMMSLGRMIAQIGTMVAANTANATAALTAASAITFGIGLIAILGAVGVAMATMSSQSEQSQQRMSVDDALIDPQGGMVLTGRKGEFQLNSEDSVLAGTNLFGGNSNSNSGDALLAESVALQKESLAQQRELNKKDFTPNVNIDSSVGNVQTQVNKSRALSFNV